MKIRILTVAGGALIGFATLVTTQGFLSAQDATPPADHTTMMQMATSSATDAEMAAKMEQMMDECLAMMKMMGAMMGGDMAGMMGGEEMPGMMGMPGTPEAAATPAA